MRQYLEVRDQPEAQVWRILKRHQVTCPRADRLITDLLELIDYLAEQPGGWSAARRREVLARDGGR